MSNWDDPCPESPNTWSDRWGILCEHIDTFLGDNSWAIVILFLLFAYFFST